MEILWPSSIEVMNLHYLDKWVSTNVDINNFNSSVVDVKIFLGGNLLNLDFPLSWQQAINSFK